METAFALLKSLYGYLRFILKVFNWIAHGFVRVAIVPIATQSHQAYLDRRRSQLRWEPLTEGVEYKDILESVLSNDPHPVSCIYIRNVGSEMIDRLDIYVVVQRSNLKFAQSESFFGIAPDEIQYVELHKIPLQDIIDVTDRGIVPAYERLAISASKIIRGDKVQDLKPLRPYTSMSLDSFLNSRWWRFDGYLFNMDAIEELKKELLFRLVDYLFARSNLFGFSFTEQLRWISHNREYRQLINIFLFWALSPKLVRSLVSWSLLIFRVRKLQCSRSD
jgi:hypothetical protein